MTENHTFAVERKRGRNGESARLADELRTALGIDGLTHLRHLIRYEVTGLSRPELEAAAPGLFADPPTDDILWDFPWKTDSGQPGLDAVREPPSPAPASILAWEYLPGQFDQRADSAARGLRLLYPDRSISVARSDVVDFGRPLEPSERRAVEGWWVNPVDSRIKNLDRSSLGDSAPSPSGIPVMSGFCGFGGPDLEGLKETCGLALALDDLELIRDWFDQRENRDPTLAELRVFDTYWSDHCRHTTFETELTAVDIPDGFWGETYRHALDQWAAARKTAGRSGKPRTLMDLATVAAKELLAGGGLEDWEISEEVNSCTLRVNALVDGTLQPWLLSFKNETHNHPTEIEPYGGASTCLGGAVRDPLADRAYVHQALRVTGGADPRSPVEETLPGKLAQRLIARGAAEGYSGYGNQLGLATAVVTERYHPGYAAKRLECGAVMGAVPAGRVRREVPVPGDRIILAGGRTGRDGVGGATGSSVAHDGTSLEKAGAEVQKGNPPEERKLQRLFRNPVACGAIKRCNDFGAGGVAVAVGELADGLSIALDDVPVKYAGLDAIELALSESQERMAVVVSPEDVDLFVSLAAEENLEATVVATVTPGRRLTMTWEGEKIVDISRDLLDTHGARRSAAARLLPPQGDVPVADDPRGDAFPEFLLEALADPRNAALRGLEERFDGTVGGTTVLASRGGIRQATPAEASVHLLPADGDVDTAGVMSVGFDPHLSSWSPFRGGQYALIDALSRLVAVGADWRGARFSLQEYFGRTGDDPEKWGRPLEALLGALTVERAWALPAIGGKDSMSGSFGDRDVPPTIIAFAATAMDARCAQGAALTLPDCTLVLFRHLSGPGGAPDFRGLARIWDFAVSLIRSELVDAAASVGVRSWAAKAAIMGFGNGIGIDIPQDDMAGLAETGGILTGSLLMAIKTSPADVLARAENAGIPTIDAAAPDGSAHENGTAVVILGQTIDTPVFRWSGKELPLARAEEAWRAPFSEVWPEENPGKAPSTGEPLSGKSPAGEGLADHRASPPYRTARPRVLIPVFPGSNGEDDAARAFQRAGGEPMVHVFRDRDPADVPEALAKLAEAISVSQILMVPGGFSAGDEPDGAGKYVAMVLRHPRVADAVSGLLDRDGLILGICNGFQALIKSGWLLTGKPGIPAVGDPTLTRNRIGRHVARIVQTVATGASSPWLSRITAGETHRVPVSHGEGRFTSSPEALDRLLAQGRVAFQYADAEGWPTLAGPDNPNGSDGAVEGILSPCGRILGKMGHSERWRRGTLVDIPGMEDPQPICEGGVEWFS